MSFCACGKPGPRQPKAEDRSGGTHPFGFTPTTSRDAFGTFYLDECELQRTQIAVPHRVTRLPHAFDRDQCKVPNNPHAGTC